MGVPATSSIIPSCIRWQYHRPGMFPFCRPVGFALPLKDGETNQLFFRLRNENGGPPEVRRRRGSASAYYTYILYVFWRPRYHRMKSFRFSPVRPEALRPHLSMSLPFFKILIGNLSRQCVTKKYAIQKMDILS